MQCVLLASDGAGIPIRLHRLGPSGPQFLLWPVHQSTSSGRWQSSLCAADSGCTGLSECRWCLWMHSRGADSSLRGGPWVQAQALPTQRYRTKTSCVCLACRLVVDLRNNGGGSFPAGVEVARMLINSGDVVLVADSQGVRDVYDATNTALESKLPLAVLVNRGTASASEVSPKWLDTKLSDQYAGCKRLASLHKTVLLASGQSECTPPALASHVCMEVE